MIKYTKTATFLFPLLEIPKKLFICDVKDIFLNTKFNLRFINAYLKDTQINKYDKNHIFVVVRNYRDLSFDGFYDKLISFPNYVDDYEEGNCLIFIFSIPEKNLKDFNLLLNGKYSQISEKAKELIVHNHFFNGQILLLKMILYKSPKLKEYWNEQLSCPPNSMVDLGDQELCSIIDLKKQVLSKEVLKKFNKTNFSKIKGE
jgi:hypothetical protein